MSVQNIIMPISNDRRSRETLIVFAFKLNTHRKDYIVSIEQNTFQMTFFKPCIFFPRSFNICAPLRQYLLKPPLVRIRALPFWTLLFPLRFVHVDCSL